MTGIWTAGDDTIEYIDQFQDASICPKCQNVALTFGNEQAAFEASARTADGREAFEFNTAYALSASMEPTDDDIEFQHAMALSLSTMNQAPEDPDLQEALRLSQQDS